MIEFLVATRNPAKFKEIMALLKIPRWEITLYSLDDKNISIKVAETGNSFLENAEIKACMYSKCAQNLFTIAEDSGLKVFELGGKPGVTSARFAGEDSDDRDNIVKLLQEMQHVDKRGAAFVTALGIARNGILMKSFVAEVKGVILRQSRGSRGFGYDPVFFYPPLGKSFAELTLEEKNKISHRARAFNKFIKFVKKGGFKNFYK